MGVELGSGVAVINSGDAGMPAAVALAAIAVSVSNMAPVLRTPGGRAGRVGGVKRVGCGGGVAVWVGVVEAVTARLAPTGTGAAVVRSIAVTMISRTIITHPAAKITSAARSIQFVP
jgi:hypothetical protein